MQSKNDLSNLSIRTTLGVIVGLLAALVLIASGIVAARALQGYRAVARVAEVNMSTDLLLQGLENIQLERG